jgi:hypothetical protein
MADDVELLVQSAAKEGAPWPEREFAIVSILAGSG